MSDASEAASALIQVLAERHQTVSVAESLTGGALTAMLTGPPGASAVVRGGLVVYATDTKATIAGVDESLLARVGPVDVAVASQLAAGVRARFDSTYGIGITGVAGPLEQDGHPVGEVHIGVAGPGGVVTASPDFGALADRAAIRQASAKAAMELLARALREADR